MWQFILPLIIFVVAYWKILAVVRRQAKVSANRQRIKVTSHEPVAGTSGRTADKANATPSRTENQSDKVIVKGAVMAGLRERGHLKNRKESKSLSTAQINVVKTMVYITICFTFCWMPVYIFFMHEKLSVRSIKGCFHGQAYLALLEVLLKALVCVGLGRTV